LVGGVRWIEFQISKDVDGSGRGYQQGQCWAQKKVNRLARKLIAMSPEASLQTKKSLSDLPFEMPDLRPRPDFGLPTVSTLPHHHLAGFS
jgi:hypothetical protein